VQPSPAPDQRKLARSQLIKLLVDQMMREALAEQSTEVPDEQPAGEAQSAQGQ